MQKSFKNVKAISLVAIIIILTAVVFNITVSTNVVQIIENDKAKTVVTMSSDPKKILADNGYEFSDYDHVKHEFKTKNKMNIEIIRANTITINADGQSVDVYETPKTVKAILGENNIELADEDIISPGLSETIDCNQSIDIQRVTYANREEKDVIKSNVIEKNTDKLEKGKTQIKQEGANGEKTRVYKEKLVDGLLVESNLVSDSVTKKVKDKIIYVGTKKVEPVIKPSSLPANAQLYKTRMTATAYTAEDGAVTASGRPAQYGNVAVDPNEIPYGTRLYITSSDGKYVYGYATAADTGGFVHSSNVDIDLFFNTEEECKNFGNRPVDVYILG